MTSGSDHKEKSCTWMFSYTSNVGGELDNFFENSKIVRWIAVFDDPVWDCWVCFTDSVSRSGFEQKMSRFPHSSTDGFIADASTFEDFKNRCKADVRYVQYNVPDDFSEILGDVAMQRS